MRVLLLNPHDVPSQGSWAKQRWDLIIDMGKSSKFSQEAWSRQFGCEVLSVGAIEGIHIARTAGQILQQALGRVTDEEGIDWWELTSLNIAPHLMSLLSLQSVIGGIPPEAELWATRRGTSLRVLEILLRRSAHSFDESVRSPFAARLGHYGAALNRLSIAQVKEIVFDKYDPGYQWRSQFSLAPTTLSTSVVLLPSAYENVSRMASDYARLLPEQPFLMVATRQSARQFECPDNVQVRDLAAYAGRKKSRGEADRVVARWLTCKQEMQNMPELELLARAGVLDAVPNWIRNGLRARNAWREVLEREPVQSVLCGDDSNFYTRLPVELATRRRIPTVDFHHGALDGRYLMKRLPSDLYLAKSEMEHDYLLRVCGLPDARVVLGAPRALSLASEPAQEPDKRDAAIFFSEPYEVTGTRAEEMYREILPGLCRVARQNGRTVIVKLHPFESIADRRRIIRQVLGSDEFNNVAVVDGPLTPELLRRAWFGITVESTTALDCLNRGIQCFLCGWISLSPCGYAQQYVRFGIGEMLAGPKQIAEIPDRLEKFRERQRAQQPDCFPVADPALLRHWLLGHETPAARSVS